MSAEGMLAEVTFLDDVDFGAAPPCDIRVTRHGEACGKPSVVRVSFTCPADGTSALFLCQFHYDELRRTENAFRCGACGGIVREWKVT